MSNFRDIYDEHNTTMVRVARKMVNDDDVVSDIVQEVFIYLHQKLSEGNKILHLRSWLYKATFNKCVDHLRRKNKFVDINLVNSVSDEDVNQELVEQKLAIELAMAVLSEQEKILVVAYSEGLSYKEMAEITGIKATSIGKTLSRTLTKMGDKLKKRAAWNV